MEIKLGIPAVRYPGSYGFNVQFFNGISTVKADDDTKLPASEEVSLLDPAPDGTGEWISTVATKWDLHFVDVFEPLESNGVDFELKYTLPGEFQGAEIPLAFENGRWYLPKGGFPAFYVSTRSLFIGKATRASSAAAIMTDQNFMPYLLQEPL